MFNIKVDYPSAEEEERILASTTPQRKARGAQGALRPGDRQFAKAGRQGGGQRIHHQICFAGWCAPTRPKDARAPAFVRELVDWGAGPRAGQFLIHGGKALAAMDGRFSVAIDDIRKVAVPVLRHRVSTNFQAQAEGMIDRGRDCPVARQNCRRRKFPSSAREDACTWHVGRATTICQPSNNI